MERKSFKLGSTRNVETETKKRKKKDRKEVTEEMEEQKKRS